MQTHVGPDKNQCFFLKNTSTRILKIDYYDSLYMTQNITTMPTSPGNNMVLNLDVFNTQANRRLPPKY
jgi:hypothetical protein